MQNNNVDLIGDFLNEQQQNETPNEKHGVIEHENIKSETRISYQQRIDNSKMWDDLYLEVINGVQVVSWQLMNRLKAFSRSTIISRLNRLVDKKLIRKASNGLYHSLDYKCSRNDRHNLWISALIISDKKGFEFEKDIDILKDKKSNFRFSRTMYDDNFIPDLVAMKNDTVIAFEVELHKKSIKKDLYSGETINPMKNKIEAYIRALEKNQFTTVYYFTDNKSVKNQVEHWINYFQFDGDIIIKLTTNEGMKIK